MTTGSSLGRGGYFWILGLWSQRVPGIISAANSWITLLVCGLLSLIPRFWLPFHPPLQPILEIRSLSCWLISLFPEPFLLSWQALLNSRDTCRCGFWFCSMHKLGCHHTLLFFLYNTPSLNKVDQYHSLTRKYIHSSEESAQQDRLVQTWDTASKAFLYHTENPSLRRHSHQPHWCGFIDIGPALNQPVLRAIVDAKSYLFW